MWGGTRYSRALFRYANSYCKIHKNRFMSDSFKCETAWNKRLESPLLQKVNLEDMFNEIDHKFNQTKSISAVDVDIFVNAVNSDSYIDEMEDIVHRLRMSSEATNIFPSTHHAFIRTYLAHGSPEELMRILNDRLNYGIFPDNFCYILLIDYFIQNGDFRNAAKIAALLMLQEDFTHDLLRYLSLYSCLKYLFNPTEWEQQKEENAAEDDGEEITVRVKYLRNPFFDNHFDLKEPNSIIGKTFIMISENIDNSISKDVLLMGYSLLKDWNAAKETINDIIKNKLSVTKTTIEVLEKFFANETNEVLKDETFQEILNGLNMLKNGNVKENIDLFQFLETIIKEEALKNETIAQEQIKVYDEWENNRDTSLREEIDKLKKAEKLETIKKKKEELIKKEQEIFFFDRENEIDLTIENKWVRYPRKWEGKKKKKRSEDVEYVPPEITKKRLNK